MPNLFQLIIFKAPPFLMALLFLGLTACEGQQDQTTTIIEVPDTAQQSELSRLASALPFENITESMGISFVHYNGAEGEKWYPEQFVGGAGFFDYDNDGFADIVAVRHHRSLTATKKPPLNSIVLYKNLNGKGFQDVTSQLQLDFKVLAYGVFAGDYDNDGWDDLYITTFGKNLLLKNKEGTRFIDVTEQMNVAGNQDLISTAALFVDVDKDDDLDLFVGNNVLWSKAQEAESQTTLNGLIKAAIGPDSFKGTNPQLYINEYPKPFRNVNIGDWSKPASTSREYFGKVLGLQIMDINHDGYVDLIAANDQIKNFAFINKSGTGFVDQAENLGIAYNNLGNTTAAMGIDITWIEGKTPHIAMGNFSEEMSSIYRLETAGVFNDISMLLGVGYSSRDKVTFGLLFDDLDLDGYADLIQVNGHVDPDINLKHSGFSYPQPTQVYRYCGNDCQRSFIELPPHALGDLAEPVVGRALASADIDHDGDLDLLISSLGGKLQLYRNNQNTGNNWLRISLDRSDHLPTIGTVVVLETGEKVQKAMLQPNRSYLSITEKVLTFGLGETEMVDRIQIFWNDGTRQQLCGIKANRQITVSNTDSLKTCQEPHSRKGEAIQAGKVLRASNIQANLKVP